MARGYRLACDFQREVQVLASLSQSNIAAMPAGPCPGSG